MVPVYRAGWQLIKVRVVMIASLICMVAATYWGLDLAQTHGLREADGGVLAPLPERLAIGAIVALLGVAFAFGMGQYGRVYAARIAFDPVRQQIHLTTVGFFWNNEHVLPVSDLGHMGPHDDINWSVVAASLVVGHPVPLVHAPWLSVWIKGWRLPLIIDQQGAVLHPKLMQKLFVR